MRESGGAGSDADLVFRASQAEGVRENERRASGEHIGPPFVLVEFPKRQRLHYVLVCHERSASQY